MASVGWDHVNLLKGQFFIKITMVGYFSKYWSVNTIFCRNK